MQPWRDTAKAPQALAYLSAVGQSASSIQPLSRPEKKPSPAPSTLKTSIGKPGPLSPSSRLAGMAPVKADRPRAPRLQTSVASETARTARSAASVSVEPPAMWNSSSVPTMRSKRCSVACSFVVTASLSTKRLSPSPWPATPQRFGR